VCCPCMTVGYAFPLPKVSTACAGCNVLCSFFGGIAARTVGDLALLPPPSFPARERDLLAEGQVLRNLALLLVGLLQLLLEVLDLLA